MVGDVLRCRRSLRGFVDTVRVHDHSARPPFSVAWKWRLLCSVALTEFCSRQVVEAETWCQSTGGDTWVSGREVYTVRMEAGTFGDSSGAHARISQPATAHGGGEGRHRGENVWAAWSRSNEPAPRPVHPGLGSSSQQQKSKITKGTLSQRKQEKKVAPWGASGARQECPGVVGGWVGGLP
jgi:hypothetical protein